MGCHKMGWITLVIGNALLLSLACAPKKETPAGMETMQATNLRVEYLTNPLGIDAVRPRLSWTLESNRRGQKQMAYRILVASSEENLSKDIADLWDTERMPEIQSNQIEYNGKALSSRMLCYWKVCVWDQEGEMSPFSAPAFWTMGLLSGAEWKAKWIGMENNVAPMYSIAERQKRVVPGPPAAYFRKTFRIDKPVVRALVYATARGLFELHLNGKRVGDDVLAPEWTDYRKRIQYRTYDVTAMLQSGDNALGAILGEGWYSGYLGFKFKRCHYGDRNSLLSQLEIQYSDSTMQTVVTDETWRCSTGPIDNSDLLMGENYDSRKEMPGWDAFAFNDDSWKSAVVLAKPAARLVSQLSEPVRVMQKLRPVKITKPKKDVYVFDLGQNIAGWARLRVKGTKGSKVTLRFAERLNPDGTIYTTNLRAAKATDTYVLKGEGEETYEPRFTFHGFQYVEATGLQKKPDRGTITGCVVHSSLPPAGTFECSNPLVNRLCQNQLWSQRGNYLSVPTDCPQRDERLGWMGDAQIFIRTGTFNMDAAAFFTKWMQDVEDAQSADGAFADTSPLLPSISEFKAAPGWGDAGVIIPWTVYRVYGDTRILERHWRSMTRWMDFLLAANPNLLRKNKLYNNYGDWLNIKADTPKDLLATAYWAYDATLMSKIAQVLGRDEETKQYEALFQKIRKAFQKEYVLADVRIKGETQTGYLLALAMNLLPEEMRPTAVDHLVENIQSKDGHLSTGFLGAAYLNPVLTESGNNDTAYRLLLTDTFPSWLYPVKQGATTIWERWDGWTAEKGFQNPGMNSFNHYSLGSVAEWLYRCAAGIDLDPGIPGYKRIVIHPRPGKGLTYVKAAYPSINGWIRSGWTMKENRFTLEVCIPVNTTALVHVPCDEGTPVLEGGMPAEKAEGIVPFGRGERESIYKVGSGVYQFVSTLTNF